MTTANQMQCPGALKQLREQTTRRLFVRKFVGINRLREAKRDPTMQAPVSKALRYAERGA